jgi:abortive infection bacteriophage resistance protein
MAQAYTKPHLSYQQQLDLMKQRGLACDDDDRALSVLRAVGYYRLSAYVYPFRELLSEPDPSGSPYSHRTDTLCCGTHWAYVEALWEFDRRLRIALLALLETIEVGVRAQIAHVLGARDPFGHRHRHSLDKRQCSREIKARGRTWDAFDYWMQLYDGLVHDARHEDYVAHIIHKHGDADQLPIWIAIETLNWGATARLFGLMLRSDQNTVSRALGVRDGKTMASWLRNLNYVRNVCAHHSRLWNRTPTIKLAKFVEGQVEERVRHAATLDRDKIYPSLAIGAYLADRIDRESDWPTRMCTTLRKFPSIPGITMVQDMGFPQGWHELSLWKRV